MKKFSFKEIKFYSGDYDQIKYEFDKGGVLVAPAASALANIDTDKQYYSSLKNSKIAILDSGFFCILLRPRHSRMHLDKRRTFYEQHS